jgi:large subunit ribosomal protein L21
MDKEESTMSDAFAIIKTGGKQYKVSEGQTLKVEKLAGEKLEFQDLLNGNKVTASVIGEGKAGKITVMKFHSKKRYKRMKGHRQAYSQIKIESIK